MTELHFPVPRVVKLPAGQRAQKGRALSGLHLSSVVSVNARLLVMNQTHRGRVDGFILH